MQTNNKEFVVDAVKVGLRAFCEMAYFKAYSKSWYGKLSRANQLQAGRAIFTLRDITLNPDAHFMGGAISNGDGLDAAFWNDYKMRARFNRFYDEVTQWYKNIASQDSSKHVMAEKNAEKIIAMSKKIRDDFVIASDGRFVLYLNKFFDNPTVRRILLGEQQKVR